VNVAELQQHIRSLTPFLTSCGAKGVAEDLQYLSARLEPFRGHKLRTFADWLVQAEAYSRGEHPIGKKPAAPKKPPAPKKAAKDPQQAQRAAERVFQDYSRATDPSVTREEIEEAIGGLGGLKRAELDALALRMEIGQKFPSIPAVVKAIRQKIFDRKGSFERAPA
jgi:hypothetical protein